MAELVESTKEASKGGFQGIKTVRGDLIKIALVDPPEGWDTKKQQVKVEMTNTIILEMFPGEEPFELKDGNYNFYIAYAEKGKKPTANTPYMKCWVASAEKMGRKPSDFLTHTVTLSKIETELFKIKNKETGEKEPVTTKNCFSFVPDEKADSQNTKTHIKNLVLGKNQTAALRELILDCRAKQFPEYKDKLNSGTLAADLGIRVNDAGVFVE